jgi:hypothetical protein
MRTDLSSYGYTITSSFDWQVAPSDGHGLLPVVGQRPTLARATPRVSANNLVALGPDRTHIFFVV